MNHVTWVDSSADGRSFGELRVHDRAWRVSVWGREVSLTRLEFRLLAALTLRPDHVHSRGELLRNVWESNALNGTRTVDVHVQRVRHKLGTAARYIQTVRGVGYRFSPIPAQR
jgi:two-component system phosphate regulon response regulator PhoB